MLLGLWKNIEELEKYLTLSELEIILKQARDKERNHQKFLAALQGIDLGAQDDGEDRVEAAKRRVAAMQTGKTEEELEFNELDFEYEVET